MPLFLCRTDGATIATAPPRSQHPRRTCWIYTSRAGRACPRHTTAVVPGACPCGIHTSRVAAARLPHLTQTVIAGLVPAIHARDRLLASRERLGAAAEWALGTSLPARSRSGFASAKAGPRVTTGVVNCAGAMAANDL